MANSTKEFASDPLLDAVHQAIMELEVLIELHEDTPTAYLLNGICNRLSAAGLTAGSREQALNPEQLDARAGGKALTPLGHVMSSDTKKSAAPAGSEPTEKTDG